METVTKSHPTVHEFLLHDTHFCIFYCFVLGELACEEQSYMLRTLRSTKPLAHADIREVANRIYSSAKTYLGNSILNTGNLGKGVRKHLNLKSSVQWASADIEFILMEVNDTYKDSRKSKNRKVATTDA